MQTVDQAEIGKTVFFEVGRVCTDYPLNEFKGYYGQERNNN